MNSANIITCCILGLLLIATVILCHDRKVHTDSIDAYIQAEVTRQLKERNVPHITSKYTTVYNNGTEILAEGE